MYEIEIWKDVIGFDGYYQISNLGYVRSVLKGNFKGRVLKNQVRGGHEYLCVSLFLNCKKQAHYIHKLVAVHFCDGYRPGLVVNHKDRDRKNNFYKNIEWVTYSENATHGLRYKLDVGLKKIVLDACTGIYYDTIVEASKAIGYKHTCYHMGQMLLNKKRNNTNLRYV